MPAPKPDDALDPLGAMLRAARVSLRSPKDPARSMSQDDLAEATGIPQSVISAVERGDRRRLDASMVLALAKALDLDAADLLQAADQRKRSPKLDADGRVVVPDDATDGGALIDQPSPIDLTPRPSRRSLDTSIG